MENLTELGEKSYNLCSKYSYHLYLTVFFTKIYTRFKLPYNYLFLVINLNKLILNSILHSQNIYIHSYFLSQKTKLLWLLTPLNSEEYKWQKSLMTHPSYHMLQIFGNLISLTLGPDKMINMSKLVTEDGLVNANISLTTWVQISKAQIKKSDCPLTSTLAHKYPHTQAWTHKQREIDKRKGGRERKKVWRKKNFSKSSHSTWHRIRYTCFFPFQVTTKLLPPQSFR